MERENHHRNNNNNDNLNWLCCWWHGSVVGWLAALYWVILRAHIESLLKSSHST